MELDKIMEHLRIGDEIHLEERARLLMEIGGFGVGGVELPLISEHSGEITPEIAKRHALENTIRNLWSGAFICYMERRFRACVILLGCLVEATLTLEIEKKGVKENRKMLTLGWLVNYCYKKGLISKDIFDAANEVNALRNLAVHLKPEKEYPMKTTETIEDIDEEVSLKVFDKPPVTVSEEGWISGDDVIFVMRPGFTGILYRFKKAADRAFRNVRFILKSLYGLRLNIED